MNTRKASLQYVSVYEPSNGNFLYRSCHSQESHIYAPCAFLGFPCILLSWVAVVAVVGVLDFQNSQPATEEMSTLERPLRLGLHC